MKRPSKPKQHTGALMLPVDSDRAGYLVNQLVRDDAEAKALIELVCGIAAIEDAATRQSVAYEAMREAYIETAMSQSSMHNYVAALYKERLAQ